MKKTVLLIILCVQLGFSQTQDALVFLADKENVAESIANPISILTQEAIDRKQLHNTAIDARDVPVNENYIAQINTNGITVYAKSKWMNSVYVRGSQSEIEDLLNLPFVTEVEFADSNLNRPSEDFFPKNKFAQETSSRIIYNYGEAANQVEMLNVDYLHENDFTGEGMIVAVMDSGFPNVMNNPAFSHIIDENRLLGTYDFVLRQTDATGTGTHGAQTFSDIGGFLQDQFVGTAPNASFYLFRTEDGPNENPVEEAWWVEALERADSLGVDVVNTSLGYQDFDNPNYDHLYEDLDGMTTIAARGANIAFEKGLLLVTSAGNDGNSFMFVATPADAPGVLTVGAVNGAGEYASFSSIGPTFDGRVKPDVMAKGRDAAVVYIDGTVITSNGTSFSSPIMAGAVTSLWQAVPSLTNGEIMDVVRQSSTLFENPTDQMGYGIPDFEEALNEALLLKVQEEALQQRFAVYPNPVTKNVNISFPKNIEKAQFVLYNVLGKKVLDTQITAMENKVDLSLYPSGIYIATVITDDNKSSFKLIKQ